MNRPPRRSPAPLARLAALAFAAAIPLGPPGSLPKALAADPLPEADRHFLDRVQPLLQARCVNCHGPEKQKGALRLDSREASLKGGEIGPSIVPGKPAESLLVQAVSHARPDLEMPPKDKLSAVEVQILERWIRDGAPWPTAPSTDLASSTPGSSEKLGDAWSDPRNPIVRIFHGQRLDLWSLKPLQPVSLPEPADVLPDISASPTTPSRSPAPSPSRRPQPHATRHPIDRFVQARLAPGRSLAAEADRRTLLRRLSFDLTGLPPTPEEVRAYVKDTAPDAFERQVDRLLNSPRFGEHQARLWLDVIRYSDSNGFDWDEFRPEAWRFRDYAVRSFNADKPFDRFIREQLAGDELIGGAPTDATEQDCLVATGYLRLGPQDNSAALFNEGARARSEWLSDLTETTASAFLAVTMSCCRCHDHKFDPFSQADHFRLRSFFEPVKYADDVPLDLAGEQASIRAQHAEVEARVAPLIRDRDAVVADARKRVRAERIASLSEDERLLLGTPPESATKESKEKSAAVERKVTPSDGDARKAFTAEEKKRHETLVRDIEALNKTKRPFLRALMATDNTNAVPVTRIHFQGDPKAEREAVSPGFLSALDPNPAAVTPPSHGRTTGRRLALADWIASEGNPLTARVFANRAWQSLFGRGLVVTPNDFGLAGARPSHPELLDWLAVDFIRNGWSVKSLLRRIVTSATYRQTSSHGDSGNADDPQHFARQSLRRVSAEQLRDALLEVSGLLQHRDGGPPVWPELPADVLQANPAFLDDNAEKTKGWYPSPPERRSVRSLYLVQKRTVRVPFLETFDLPENSTSCPRRNESIVAPQALSLLNSPESLAATHALASRVAREAGPGPEARVRRLFDLTVQREPSAGELDLCREFLNQRDLPQLARAMLNLNEFAFID
jgi:mono/diheme cytochrome c family protein